MTPLHDPDILMLLDAPASGGAGMSQTLILVAMIFGIFYFLMFRPQQKQQKEHQSLLASLKKDDRVVLTSGLHGKIWAVKDDTVIVEIGRDVRVEYDKASVRRKIVEGDSAPIKQK
ncbi:MAG: preprotein translocase subunit YajC [Pseudomonadota bacterium]